MKIVRMSLAALGILAALAGPAAADDFIIDAKGAHASINFRISHLGFSWLVGRFDTFSGEFSYDAAKPEASKVKVEIDAASINSNHAERDKHLRSADFLDVAKYPSATFQSREVKMKDGGKSATIVGDLTLRGVTKPVTIEAQIVGGGEDPWGGYRQGFSGTTRLTLADFGILKNLGESSREVELTLNIEGVRK